MKKEIDPRKFSTAMDRAAMLDKKAKQTGIPVSSLIAPFEVWKKPSTTKPSAK